MSATMTQQQFDPPENRQTTAIAFPRAVPQLLATVEKLEIMEREVLMSLATQSDEEILDTRRKSKLAGRFAWRIEAACDAQIIARAKRLKGGRGIKDDDEAGINSAVRRRSKIIGCTPNTIKVNARIFHLMQAAETSNNGNTSLLQILDEKGFYIAALSAIDEQAALVLFAQKKSEPKRFRVADAFRLLVKLGLTKKVASSKGIRQIRTASRDKIFAYLKKLKTVLLDCPDTDTFDRVLQDCYTDVDDQIKEMFEDDVCTSLREAHQLGNHNEDQLSRATEFPLEVVSRLMLVMGEDGEFIKVPCTGSQRWHKVGDPLPEELRRGNGK